MKTFLSILVFAVTFSACQKKQYFTSCLEIDLVKKGNELYLKGDWAGLKALYADTTKVLVNSWFGGEMTADQFHEIEKADVATMAEYSIGDDGIYEMVINDQGEHWVHAWFNWKATYKNGKSVSTVVHISSQVENNKIVWQGFVLDTLPSYLSMTGDTMVMIK